MCLIIFKTNTTNQFENITKIMLVEKYNLYTTLFDQYKELHY